jgi:TonB-dependent SusC/RagA subfamily outer membrane receptor
MVRGVAGVGGSSEPTYVVNGMYMTARQFSAINPADVESISILKDAAATAQYGARGANG